MKIIEIDERNNPPKIRMLPSYRVSIEIEDTEIIIKREYFYYGFYESTCDFDNFWFNNKNNGNNHWKDLTKCSFVTRNLSDSKYLKIKEKKLIKKFYNKLIKNENNLKIERDIKNIEYNDRIEECQKNQNCDLFIKIKRIKKLKNLNKIL